MSDPKDPANKKSRTEAPTSGVTEDKLKERVEGPGLNSEQLAFVNLLAQYYSLHHVLMPIAVAIQDYKFEYDEFLDLMKSDKVQAALTERGVSIKRSDLDLLGRTELVRELTDNEEEVEPTDEICSQCGSIINPSSSSNNSHWSDRTLSSLQLIVANTMLDLIDSRSQKKKLQDLGVSTALYQSWLKDPLFADYMKNNASNMLKENEHEVYLALLDKVRMGDSSAINTYLEMQGIYVKQTSANTGSSQMTDFKSLMIRILEIITEESEPEAAYAIGERIRTLIGIENTANALMNSLTNVEETEIIEPEITPARQLSPRLQALMEKGVGDN